MEQLLEQINQTFDQCMENASEETTLQLKIIKNNINTLFKEYQEKNASIEPNEKVEETPVPAMTLDPNKKTILVVDDSSIVRNYLNKLLGEKYNMKMAEGGQEAINALADETPEVDAILLDLMMPGIDGFGVLEYLTGRNLSIPVVVISGDNTKETINRAFEYHVVDIIEKPFDSKTIETKIERIL